MKDGFRFYYVKDGIGYPVGMTDAQYEMTQYAIAAVFHGGPVKVLDYPIQMETLGERNARGADNA